MDKLKEDERYIFVKFDENIGFEETKMIVPKICLDLNNVTNILANILEEDEVFDEITFEPIILGIENVLKQNNKELKEKFKTFYNQLDDILYPLVEKNFKLKREEIDINCALSARLTNKKLANLNEDDFGIQIFQKGSVEIIKLPNGGEFHIQH